MKPFRHRWMPVTFSTFIACVLVIRFFAGMRGEQYPYTHVREWWEYPWMLSIGRILVQPLCVFVDNVLTRIDFRLGCASFWHPMYLAGFFVLWIGYSGTFWLAWTWISNEINRRWMK